MQELEVANSHAERAASDLTNRRAQSTELRSLTEQISTLTAHVASLEKERTSLLESHQTLRAHLEASSDSDDDMLHESTVPRAHAPVFRPTIPSRRGSDATVPQSGRVSPVSDAFFEPIDAAGAVPRVISRGVSPANVMSAVAAPAGRQHQLHVRADGSFKVSLPEDWVRVEVVADSQAHASDIRVTRSRGPSPVPEDEFASSHAVTVHADVAALQHRCSELTETLMSTSNQLIAARATIDALQSRLDTAHSVSHSASTFAQVKPR